MISEISDTSPSDGKNGYATDLLSGAASLAQKCTFSLTPLLLSTMVKWVKLVNLTKKVAKTVNLVNCHFESANAVQKRTFFCYYQF